ncbi:imm11 family protein [Parapedomonas caeni]
MIPHATPNEPDLADLPEDFSGEFLYELRPHVASFEPRAIDLAPWPGRETRFLSLLSWDYGEEAIADEFIPPVRLRSSRTMDEFSYPFDFWGGWNRPNIVSEAFKTLLSSFVTDKIEFFPVTLHIPARPDDGSPDDGSGEHLEGYWWVHHWNRLDIYDIERSVSDFRWSIDGQRKIFRHWQRLCLTVPSVSDHLFGITGLIGRRFISPQLRDAIVASGLAVPVFETPLVPASQKYHRAAFEVLKKPYGA